MTPDAHLAHSGVRFRATNDESIRSIHSLRRSDSAIDTQKSNASFATRRSWDRRGVGRRQRQASIPVRFRSCRRHRLCLPVLRGRVRRVLPRSGSPRQGSYAWSAVYPEPAKSLLDRRDPACLMTASSPRPYHLAVRRRRLGELKTEGGGFVDGAVTRLTTASRGERRRIRPVSVTRRPTRARRRRRGARASPATSDRVRAASGSRRNTGPAGRARSGRRGRTPGGGR